MKGPATSPALTCDTLVVGAGPAGTAHAIACARMGASVVLAGPESRHAPYTLELVSGRSREALERLGLFEEVLRRATPCAGIFASWSFDDRIVDKPAALDPLGPDLIVDRSTLDSALVDHAASLGVTVAQSSVKAVEREDSGWRVLAGGAWHRCDRVVLATGRASSFPARCGIARRVNRHLVAAVGCLDRGMSGLVDRLCVDATSEGWWYALGLSDQTAIGFVTDTLQIRAAPGSAIDFAVQRLEWPLASAGRPHFRLAYTAETTDPFPEGMTAVGDAALAVDPLSGHGLALAFESAWMAASEPNRYPEWLADQSVHHANAEGAVYASAGRSEPFWLRRGPHADQGYSPELQPCN